MKGWDFVIQLSRVQLSSKAPDNRKAIMTKNIACDALTLKVGVEFYLVNKSQLRKKRETNPASSLITNANFALQTAI